MQDGYHDTLGRTVRDNLLLARECAMMAERYERDLAHLSHAANTAAYCRENARHALNRCRSIIARRFGRAE